MGDITDKNNYNRAIEAATILRKLKPDEQWDALNIIRGFGAAKGVDVIPSKGPDDGSDKSA